MFLAILAGMALALITGAYWYLAVRHQNGPTTPDTTQREQIQSVRTENAVQRRTSDQLHKYLQWLQDNNVQGYIGEYGWPSGADERQWAEVAQIWLQQLEGTNVWTTAWAAGSRWGTDYPLSIYTAPTGTDDISIIGPQASQLETFWKTDDRKGLHGVNVAGMEFGTNISVKNRGVAGRDYFYEPAVSYAFLAQHGVKLVRLPLQWERVQPKLSGSLDAAELSAIRGALDAAAAHGIQVVLDLHNYGAYADGKSQLKLGSSGLTADALSNFWSAMTQQFGGHSAVVGYSIMNEPHDLWPSSKPADAAKKWEVLTQQVVSSLRAAGYSGTICVPGYDWSSLARWTDNHAKAWIKDPQNNIRYEAHHYWDADGSGKYTKSFTQELADD